MAFCVKCGFQLQDDFSFCPRCATPVVRIDQANNAQFNQNIQPIQLMQTQTRFISLKCPSCDGQMDVNNDVSICICKYCGTQFLIERDKYDDEEDEWLTDELYPDAGREVILNGKGSHSVLQRKFLIGFNRADRLLNMLGEDGVIEQGTGLKRRAILMTLDEFEAFLKEHGVE